MRLSKLLLLLAGLLPVFAGCIRDAHRPSVVLGRQENGKYQVKIVYLCPTARSVYLAGTFNNWTVPRMEDDTGNMQYLPVYKMKPGDNPGEWMIILDLPPGVQQYRFFVDLSRWEIDERNHLTIRRMDGVSCNYLIVK